MRPELRDWAGRQPYNELTGATAPSVGPVSGAVPGAEQFMHRHLLDVVRATTESFERARALYPFAIEFQSSPFKRLIFGIQSGEKQCPNRELVQKRLISAFGSARQSGPWPWYRSARQDDPLLPLPENWQISKDPWLGVNPGTTAKTLMACAKQFHEALTLT